MTFKEDQNYLSATEQEKKWFDHFFESRDPRAATQAAYRVTTDESADAYSKQVMKRVHIDTLIKTWVVPKPPLPTVDDLKRLYIDLSKDTNATVRDRLTALNSYERLSGFIVKGKPLAPQEDDLAYIND